MYNIQIRDKIITSVLGPQDLLTPEEEIRIHEQFCGDSWKRNRQILWTGMQSDQAQKWADEHDMQTLTTAMGPLMDSKSPLCPRRKSRKGNKNWSKYVHGASAIYALHISRGAKVTVLSPPPPQRFHPSGLSSFQVIELPILMAAIVNGACLRIEIVHPGVTGAENFYYQLWPLDEADRWTAAFRTAPHFEYKWRMVKGQVPYMPAEHALQQMKQERAQTISAGTRASTTESTISTKGAKASKKRERKATSSNKTIDFGPACSKQKSKKSKKKRKKTLTGAKATTSQTTTITDGPIASRTRSKTMNKTISPALSDISLPIVSSSTAEQKLKKEQKRLEVLVDVTMLETPDILLRFGRGAS